MFLLFSYVETQDKSNSDDLASPVRFCIQVHAYVHSNHKYIV